MPDPDRAPQLPVREKFFLLSVFILYSFFLPSADAGEALLLRYCSLWTRRFFLSAGVPLAARLVLLA
jgi:hypothetical protein